ncbi:hypothetical protein K0M31_006663 [Melipona bicolor]|uniref:Uncharacterized protein n=1 Tax=Melipona bicolor TaxID=60889 RepID=A0AA40KL53_9HYME|nr:hypothetical protein K0M31_006663 [Melipona bicolor]
MKVAMFLTNCHDHQVFPSKSLLRKPRHELKAMPKKAQTVRFCKICYQNNSKKLGRKIAKICTKKVVTYCEDCGGSPFLCLKCFNTTHRNMCG